jgi:hypothetical protein
MTQPKRNRPGTGSQAAPSKSSTDILNDSPDRWHATPTADERREAKLLAELSELGYSVSVPCLVCSHPLTSPRSTALHVGPKCRSKAVTHENH